MPPPRSIEEWLYRKLMDSASFHRFVRSVHAKINGLPPPHKQDRLNQKYSNYTVNDFTFRPTSGQKFKAFRVIWADEFKRAIGLKR